jgi:hypothetical protein
MVSPVVSLSMSNGSSSLGFWNAEYIDTSNDGVRMSISSISMAWMSVPSSKPDGSSTSAIKVRMALKQYLSGNYDHLKCLCICCRDTDSISVASWVASMRMLDSRIISAIKIRTVSQWQARSSPCVCSIVGACQLLGCTHLSSVCIVGSTLLLCSSSMLITDMSTVSQRADRSFRDAYSVVLADTELALTVSRKRQKVMLSVILVHTSQ